MNTHRDLASDQYLETLGLVGDGDDLDLIEAIETAFNLQLTDEPSKWTSVGDIYEFVLSNADVEQFTQQQCSSQMAFYDVRNAICELLEKAPGAKIKPDTKFVDLGLKNLKPLQALLEKTYKLAAPSMELSKIGCLCVFILAAAAAIWILHSGFGPGYLFLVFIAGASSLALLPLRYRGSIGEFSNTLADLNYARYVNKGARTNPDRIWQALCQVIEDSAEADRHRVGPETLLMIN